MRHGAVATRTLPIRIDRALVLPVMPSSCAYFSPQDRIHGPVPPAIQARSRFRSRVRGFLSSSLCPVQGAQQPVRRIELVLFLRSIALHCTACSHVRWIPGIYGVGVFVPHDVRRQSGRERPRSSLMLEVRPRAAAARQTWPFGRFSLTDTRRSHALVTSGLS